MKMISILIWHRRVFLSCKLYPSWRTRARTLHTRVHVCIYLDLLVRIRHAAGLLGPVPGCCVQHAAHLPQTQSSYVFKIELVHTPSNSEIILIYRSPIDL